MAAMGYEVAGLDGGRILLSSREMETLGSRLAGPLLSPGDDRWGEATLVWNGMVSNVPALVIQPTSPGDVSAAVRFAGERRLLISVKGGGHNIAGTAVAPGGLLLDMSRMHDVRVDPAARLAHVGPGCLLRDVDRATQAHGLATVLGFISETGVAGLTLGGGLGYLTRRFGFAVDNLDEVEIVTADGAIRTASRSENDDLFWAVRGGGGNFGVVTRFTFRLHDVGPTVFGGLIAWPFDRCAEVLRTYRTFTTEAPRELAAWLLLMRAPPAPFIPQEWQGERTCTMAVCWSGDPAQAEDALAPIRGLGAAVVDLLREQPYVELQSYLDAAEPKGMHYYWKTGWLSGLGDDLLAMLRELFADCPVPGAEIGMLHLAGALNERGWDDGAVGNRDAHYAIGVNGMWAPDDPDAGMYRDWIRSAWERAREHSTGRSYINFQTADEDDERVRASYGPNYERLTEIKRKYDPGNLFRSNRNIRPAGG